MATTKKKSIWAIVGGIVGLLAVTAAAIGIATAVRQNTCKHVWNDGEVKVEATCEKEGKLVFKCEECGKYETEKIEKLAHTWTYVEAKMPTCTEDGHTEYTACELCGEYKNGVEPQILLAEGHTEIELEAVAPTCTEPGLTAGKYCTTCEEIMVEQRSLKAKGHTLVTLEAKAPTCTETGLTAGKKCATCDTVYVEQKEVPLLGHIDEDEDEVCDRCEEGFSFIELIDSKTIEYDGTDFEAEGIDNDPFVVRLTESGSVVGLSTLTGERYALKYNGMYIFQDGTVVDRINGVTMIKTTDYVYYYITKDVMEMIESLSDNVMIKAA